MILCTLLPRQIPVTYNVCVGKAMLQCLCREGSVATCREGSVAMCWDESVTRFVLVGIVAVFVLGGQCYRVLVGREVLQCLCWRGNVTVFVFGGQRHDVCVGRAVLQ